MDGETLRRVLERAGLTSYQADAYLTLLEVGTAPAVEIARQCSVPVSQIYEVLRNLKERGYVNTFEEDKLYAQPTDLDTIRSDLLEQRDLLEDASEAIEGRYQQPELIDHRISVTSRADTVFKHAAAFFEEAETVIEFSGTAAQYEQLVPALRAAYERDVVVRASIHPGPDGVELADLELAGVVSEVRNNAIHGPLVVVVDRHRVCFVPNVRSEETYGILIRDRILPVSFHWHFLSSLWDLYPRVYIDDDHFGTYVTIEEFIRDAYDFWRDGYTIEVSVKGIDPQTDESKVLTGTIEDILYPRMAVRESPRLSDLASIVNMTLDVDGEYESVGGWGAVVEDVEMHRLEIVDVRPPTP